MSPCTDPFLNLFPFLLNEMVRMSLARSREKNRSAYKTAIHVFEPFLRFPLGFNFSLYQLALELKGFIVVVNQ